MVDLHCRLVIKVNIVLLIDFQKTSACGCYSSPNTFIGGIIKNIKNGTVHGDLYLLWSGEINFHAKVVVYFSTSKRNSISIAILLLDISDDGDYIIGDHVRNLGVIYVPYYGALLIIYDFIFTAPFIWIKLKNPVL